MTPILMTPSVYCACAVPHASASASALSAMTFFMIVLPSVSSCSRCPGFVETKLSLALHAEIFVQLPHICVEFRIGEALDDFAMLHHAVAIRNGRRETEI